MKTLALLALLAVSAAPRPFRTAEPGYAFRFPGTTARTPPSPRSGGTSPATSRAPAARSATATSSPSSGRRLPAGDWRGSPAWRSDQIHLAHAALTDVGGGLFLFDERLGREGIPAAAARDRLDLRNGAWTASMDPAGAIRLHFTVRAWSLDLELSAQGPPVVFGEEGRVRKGDDPACSSHYLTFPRLGTRGTLVRPPHGDPPGPLLDGPRVRLGPARTGTRWAGTGRGSSSGTAAA